MARSIGDLAGAATRTADGRADNRAKLVRAIRAACARLGIDDDERRAIQQDRYCVASLTDMTPQQLGQFLDHLNRGWKRSAAHPHQAKVRALWWSLYWLGCINVPTDAALTEFVKRQTGVDRIGFLGHEAARSVIEAQKSWLDRAGVTWDTDLQVAETARASGDPEYDRARADRWAVLTALVDHLHRYRVLPSTNTQAIVCHLVGAPDAPWSSLGPATLDTAIRALGKRFRRASKKDRDAWHATF